MHLTHISDTHGDALNASLFSNTDIIVHSGDLFPNIRRSERTSKSEIEFQQAYANTSLATFVRSLSIPFIFCAGNHDFLVPNLPGLIDCTNKLVTVRELRFYRFPWVPYIAGEWNWEATPAEMVRHVDTLAEVLTGGVDVLVCHCPPAGLCSGEGAYGNTALANMLTYAEFPLPKLLLCGHMHEAEEVKAEFGNMIVSNAATRIHVFDV